MPSRLDKDRLRPGVGEEPPDLGGRGRLVDRNGDGADVPERVVDQGPLVPRAGQQRYAVTGLDTAGDESLGDAAHLFVEGEGADVLPARAVTTAERDSLGMVARRWR